MVLYHNTTVEFHESQGRCANCKHEIKILHDAQTIGPDSELATLRAENARLKTACRLQANEIEQILGKALGYPQFKDDQKNFPGATEADGVCVGDQVAETLAAQAAERIARLREVAGELLVGALKECKKYITASMPAGCGSCVNPYDTCNEDCVIRAHAEQELCAIDDALAKAKEVLNG